MSFERDHGAAAVSPYNFFLDVVESNSKEILLLHQSAYPYLMHVCRKLLKQQSQRPTPPELS